MLCWGEFKYENVVNVIEYVIWKILMNLYISIFLICIKVVYFV